MNTPSAHAPDVEELLLLAAEKSYGANEETFPEAAHAVNCLMSLHARRQGSALQQLAQEIIDRIAPQDDDSDTQSDWSPEDRDPPDWNTYN
jgi:hypothetical protein